MIYKRQYVQFNKLVLTDVDADDPSVSFKRNRTEYVRRNGSFTANRGELLAEAIEFSMTIKLHMKDLPCEFRPFYRDFALGQLAETGRLWAIQNNTLIWAYAEMDAFGEKGDSRKNTLELDIDVTLPEGVWHKADPQKTFLEPWYVCEFMDCEGFRNIQPCVSEDCCHCPPNEVTDRCDCCECLSRDMALCYHMDEIKASCNRDYLFTYSCEAAERHFNSLTHYQGVKMCGCGVIAGLLYSNTDIPTKGIKIRFSGKVKDVSISINDNENIILGEYDDLVIMPDGTISYGCDCNEADVDKWFIPDGNTYGWTIHQGNNRVVIDTGNCCGTTCVYLEHDPLTI